MKSIKNIYLVEALYPQMDDPCVLNAYPVCAFSTKEKAEKKVTLLEDELLSASDEGECDGYQIREVPLDED